MWCNLKETGRDLQFAAAVDAYLGFLRKEGRIEGYQLARRKLGFGPPELGEFQITIRVKDMAQLERAFLRAATRAPDAEKLHAAVYGAITDFRSALFRDFPDEVRGRPMPEEP